MALTQPRTASSHEATVAADADRGEPDVLARLGVTDAEWDRRAAAAVALLDSWAGGDEDEQRETWERLRAALDEDRQGTRRLFP